LNWGHLGALSSGQAAIGTDAKLQSNLTEFAKYGEVVGIYLKYGQPVILIVIDADKLDDEQLVGRFVLLHNVTKKMRDFSMRIIGGALSSRTLAFTVFKSHSRAQHFKEALSGQCKKFSLFNKVWVLPYTVDLERKRMYTWKGLPMTEFKEDLMERVLFD
jgi:hypothetical protein